MQVKIKKLNHGAVIPTYAHPSDAAMDLTAVSKNEDNFGNIVYGTGLAIEIPENYVGLIFPRSSISRYDLLLTNSVGVIDCGYTGEVTLKFKDTSDYIVSHYGVGDRVGQLIIIPRPKIKFIEVLELAKTERGTGGFGSTGR